MNKIACVVVLYHPDIDSLLKQLASLQPQVAKIIIVDNGSQPNKPGEIEKIIAQHNSCSWQNTCHLKHLKVAN